VDGFFRATWMIRRSGGTAVLLVEPFTRLSDEDADAVSREGAGLLAFAAPQAQTHDVRIVGADL